MILFLSVLGCSHTITDTEADFIQATVDAGCTGITRCDLSARHDALVVEYRAGTKNVTVTQKMPDDSPLFREAKRLDCDQFPCTINVVTGNDGEASIVLTGENDDTSIIDLHDRKLQVVSK